MGYSVLEVIKEARGITSMAIPYTVVDRRPGDPAELVAASVSVNELLNWQPKHSALGDILRSMWMVYANNSKLLLNELKMGINP